MIRAAALLVAGLAAAGLWLADSFALLAACWILGSVVHAGLVAGAGSTAVRNAVREVFLVELFGVWVLLMAGLRLVLVGGGGDLASLDGAPPVPVDATWVGIGVLLVVTGRLGLAPLAPWPVRLAAAPPLVRVFLHALLHPLTALLLWWRLDSWLLPWHRDVGLWLASGVTLAATVAAAGERLGARRAALLTVASWSGVLAQATSGDGLAWLASLTGACAAVSWHLVAASPRWPRAVRRGLLALSATGVGLALFPAAAGASTTVPSTILLGLAVVGMIGVTVHWAATLPPVLVAGASPRRPALPWLTPLARRSRRAGPVLRAVRGSARGLGAVVAVTDRLVLAGVTDGLALLALGVGWLVSWCDRRGLDAVENGLAAITASAGRMSRQLVAGAAAGLLLGAIVVALLLSLILGTVGR